MEGNVSSPVRYSYLSILPDDNVDIAAAFPLRFYFSFSSLILPSTVMISCFILSKRLSLKLKVFPVGRRVLLTKNNIVLPYTFCKDSLSL